MEQESDEAGAERKARLLRQGQGYRVGIVHARASIAQGIRPDALFHSALNHAGWALRTRMDHLLGPTGVHAGAMMPIAVSLIGFIARRRLLKPALGVLLAAGAVALYVRQRHIPARNQG